MFTLLDPTKAAMMSAGFAGLQASGPSRMPRTMGSILGPAGAAGMEAYQDATKLGLQQQLLQDKLGLQRSQLDETKRLHDAQIGEIAAQADQRRLSAAELQRKAAAQETFRAELGNLEDPSDPVSVLGIGVKTGALDAQQFSTLLGQAYQKKADREQKIEELKLRLADQKLTREDRERFQRELSDSQKAHQESMVRLTASLRPPPPAEPLVPVIGPNGPVYTPRSQAIGQKVPPSGTQARMPAEIQRMNIALDAMDKGLDEYESLLKEYNPRSLAQMNPEKRAQAESRLAAIQLEWKEAAALGALTGPDLEIMDKVLTSPASAKGVFFGSGGLSKQLQEARAYAKRRKDGIRLRYPETTDAGKDPWEK
jgi:hypothetical protein